MDRINQRDVLIAGQGVAGSLLAWELVRLGMSVTVADDNAFSCRSSRAAAGLINPITGQRIVLAEEWFKHRDAGAALYRSMEQALGTSFYRQLPIVRLVKNPKEADRWRERLEQEGYSDVIKPMDPGALDASVPAPFGAYEILGGGRVDLERFLGAVRTWLADRDGLQRVRLRYEDIKPGENGITWKGVTYRWLVFCEGAAGSRNPFFPSQPFNLVKGESLVVTMHGFPADAALVGSAHLVPYGGEVFWVGGTYDREHLDEVPSMDGRRTLERQLRELTSHPFLVKDHLAAVRPATVTREPFVAHHPEIPGMIMLNGLGAKGALKAPWLAQQLSEEIHTALAGRDRL